MLGLVEVGRLGEYIGGQEVVLPLPGSAWCKKKWPEWLVGAKKLGLKLVELFCARLPLFKGIFILLSRLCQFLRHLSFANHG